GINIEFQRCATPAIDLAKRIKNLGNSVQVIFGNLELNLEVDFCLFAHTLIERVSQTPALFKTVNRPYKQKVGRQPRSKPF
ncbi:MAG TPA: hypothetical protein PKC93_18075, partial [Candidatus Obscuribacter sp.]|nr:hypothetical protein [Candidatus Obscuribacter sp.]